MAAGSVEGFVQQHLAAMAVIAAQRPAHYFRWQAAHPQLVLFAEIGGKPSRLGDLRGNHLGGVIKRRKAIVAGGQKPLDFGHRIVRVAAFGLCGVAVGQFKLAFGPSGVEAQERLAHAGETGGDIRDFHGRQINVGKHRVL